MRQTEKLPLRTLIILTGCCFFMLIFSAILRCSSALQQLIDKENDQQIYVEMQ